MLRLSEHNIDRNNEKAASASFSFLFPAPQNLTLGL
jgi:hypothetical protein